jgi:hypothetical protein
VTEENRWSISELLARYELEPELSDVFVEGAFDREVLAQAFTDPITRPTFYEIDVVDVPIAVLSKHGMSSGNKQRVVALSKELGGLPHAAKVVCLADRDLDHWFGTLSATRRLRWTVYCSIESHFLTVETVSDILVTTGRTRIKNLDPFFGSLIDALKVLYALRLADRQLALALKWVSLRKYLSRDGDSVVFGAEKYALALLNSNAKASRHREFSASYQGWLNQLNCDIRLAARGHDYAELLAWAVAEFGGQKEFASTSAIERLFVLLARSVGTLPRELQ